jgi:hypothetical protein
MSAHGQGLHPQDIPAYQEAARDLAYLFEMGALAGVAEVIRERRHQIEQLGYTPERDRRHDNAELIGKAVDRINELGTGIAEGTAGWTDAERTMAQAGALAAAEIDRLETEFTPEDNHG